MKADKGRDASLADSGLLSSPEKPGALPLGEYADKQIETTLAPLCET